MEAANATAPRWHCPVLLVLTLGTTLYVCAHTDAVTEDSIIFVQYARQLGGEVCGVDQLTPPPRGPWAASVLAQLTQCVPALSVVIRGEQHPCYPVAILGARRMLAPWLSVDPVWMWIRAGQIISTLAGLLLTASLYWLGRHLLGAGAAFAGCLILLLTPPFLQIRADVLSDGPGLAFMILSGCFACRLLEGGRLRDAAACGISGSIAYLMRPESMQLALAAAGILLFRFARAPHSRRQTLLQLAALIGPLVLTGAPYMFLRGSPLTKERRAFTMVDPQLDNRTGWPPGARTAMVDPQLDNRTAWRPGTRTAMLSRHMPEPIVKVAAGIRRFFGRWAECVGSAALLAVAIGLYVRRRDLVARPAHRFIWGAVVCNFIVLPGILFYWKGYIDWRHLLPVAAMTVFWAWAGVNAVCGWVVDRLPTVPPRFLAAAAFAALLLATAGGSGLADFIENPLHGDRHGQVRAGNWLRHHSAAGRALADPEGLPSFYARRDLERYWDNNHPALTDAVLERILQSRGPVDYLVVSSRYLGNHDRPDGLPTMTPSFHLECVKQFRASIDSEEPKRILIYRVTAHHGS